MAHRRHFLSAGKLSVLTIVVLLLADQAIKIWVKTHMTLGEMRRVTDWCYIYFVENIGMAYGMTFINKLLLSSLRIVLVGLIAYYIYNKVKEGARLRYIFLLSMIVAGAAGNIIDSVLYGQIFDESTFTHVSQWVPFGEGYAPVLKGKVVDMFYFPIVHTTWPQWMPIVGGNEFVFFSPIFNFADACISVAVVAIFLFCRKDIDIKNTTDSPQNA